jgi:ABC-2 type transport system ATP-binding protein
MDAIKTEALTKHFTKGFWWPRPYAALEDLTLHVGQGEVFGFLGPNGAGKTTTLKLLLQLIFPTSGRAEILGRPVGDVSVRRRIGYLPENPYFYDNLTAEELLVYFARVFGYSLRDGRGRAARLLDEVGIGEERRFQLRKFSKGMVQRVGIAQALINEPEVVFLDEPMSGLDPLGRREVRELILRLRDRGCTVFFSSHVLSDAEALCSRVGILAKGRLVASGPLDSLTAFEVRGWELVVSGLRNDVLTRVRPSLSAVTPLGGGRFALELPLTTKPEGLLPELVATGAHIVSLNPLRTTLEDFFIAQVRGADDERVPEDDRVSKRAAS